MDIVTKQLKLEELSDLKYEVHMGDSQAVHYCSIMILKFLGSMVLVRLGTQMPDICVRLEKQ